YLPIFASRGGSPPLATLFPYTTLFRSVPARLRRGRHRAGGYRVRQPLHEPPDRLARRAQSARRLHNFELHAVAVNGSPAVQDVRSEEHTSELQSRSDLVCRLLPEKKKT